MDSLAVRVPTLLSHEGGKHPFFCTRDTSVYGCVFLGFEICGFKSMGSFPYRHGWCSRCLCNGDDAGSLGHQA